MKLSIGLIIKNEEKHIENCLKALQPLKDAFECEIIVADTGSTDNSREIAERYADCVYDFEWIDDFGAARNSTLERATGEWYMFIDADEYMENHNDLIDFFTSNEYKKYSSATYVIRNYYSLKTDKYSDFSGSRLTKRTKNTRFIGSIHEHLVLLPPIKNLATTVRHYGYDNDDAELMVKKTLRNKPLIENELKKDPNNPRLMGLLCDALLAEGLIDEALESFYKQLDIHKKQKTGFEIRVKTYEGLIRLLVNNKSEYQKAIDIALDFIKEKNNVYAMDIDYYYYISQAYYNLDKKEEAIEYFQKYIDLLDQYEAGNLLTPEMRFSTINCGNNRNIALKYQSRCLFETDKAEEALDIAQKISTENGDVSIDDKIEIIFKARLKLEKYSDIAETYMEFYNSANIADSIRYTNKVEISLLLNNVNREELFRAFAHLPFDSNYTMLCRLRLAEDSNEAKPYLNFFLFQKDIPNSYGDVLYYSMKFDFPINRLIVILTTEQLSDFLNNTGNLNKDFGIIANKYFKTRNFEDDFKSLIISYFIKEYILLLNSANSENLSDEQYIETLNSYTKDMISFIYKAYSELALSDENAFILPANCRFGYYMNQANNFKSENNQVEYIRHLKLALTANPQMKKGIELILEVITKELENANASTSANKELQNFAGIIKTQIKQLITANNINAAKQLIAQYRDIIPNDQEVDDIELMMNEKPQGFVS